MPVTIISTEFTSVKSTMSISTRVAFTDDFTVIARIAEQPSELVTVTV